MPSVVIIVRDERGRTLLTKDAGFSEWFPPGGSIDPDESPRDAAVREMQEETGLPVEPVRILGVRGGREFLHAGLKLFLGRVKKNGDTPDSL